MAGSAAKSPEAARQSGRSDTLRIDGPVNLKSALELTASTSCRLILHPEDGIPLADAQLQFPTAIFVGAEGGFTPDELEFMAQSGCTRVTLACPVLRTETAATVACALALHRLAVL